MNTQDTIGPMTPLTPPRVLNTYKDRRRKARDEQRRNAKQRKSQQHPASNHIDEYV